jgi:hypothetical protein
MLRLASKKPYGCCTRRPIVGAQLAALPECFIPLYPSNA